jgi:hypothetical protein
MLNVQVLLAATPAASLTVNTYEPDTALLTVPEMTADDAVKDSPLGRPVTASVSGVVAPEAERLWLSGTPTRPLMGEQVEVGGALTVMGHVMRLDTTPVPSVT